MGSKKIARQTSTLASGGSKGRRRVRKHVRAAATRSFVLSAAALVAIAMAIVLLASLT